MKRVYIVVKFGDGYKVIHKGKAKDKDEVYQFEDKTYHLSCPTFYEKTIIGTTRPVYVFELNNPQPMQFDKNSLAMASDEFNTFIKRKVVIKAMDEPDKGLQIEPKWLLIGGIVLLSLIGIMFLLPSITPKSTNHHGSNITLSNTTSIKSIANLSNPISEPQLLNNISLTQQPNTTQNTIQKIVIYVPNKTKMNDVLNNFEIHQNLTENFTYKTFNPNNISNYSAIW